MKNTIDGFNFRNRGKFLENLENSQSPSVESSVESLKVIRPLQSFENGWGEKITERAKSDLERGDDG